jgi:hypothetical protein
MGLLLAFVGRCPAQEESFRDLLKYLPPQANAILLIDVPAISNSPLGVKKDWAKAHQRDYVSGVSRLPPEARKVVMGAQLNPTLLANAWEIGLVQMSYDVSPTQLAKAEAGTIDTVADTSVVLSPRNAYFLPLGPKLVGGMRPANRQDLGRWLRAYKQNYTVTISGYLQQAAAMVGDKHQVVMALDLADVLDPQGLRMRLKDSKSLAGAQVDMDALIKALSGLKGVTFTISIDNAIHGRLRLDFSESAKDFRAILKPLVMEALGKIGAYIEDMESWETTAAFNTVTIEGPMSDRGARHILSLVFSPGTTGATNLSDPSAPATPESKAQASLKYFRSVTKLLDDLQKEKIPTFNKLAYLYFKTAKEVDELPMLQVDEDLLKYGAAVASTLRGLSNLAKGTGAQNKVAQYSMADASGYGAAYGYGYGYGGYGYGGGYGYVVPGQYSVNNIAQMSSYIASGTLSEGATRQQTWKNINDATAQLRKQMTERYQIEFL